MAMRKVKGRKMGTLINDSPLEKEVVYPQVSFDLDHLPEARDWKNGDTYLLTLEVRQTSIYENKSRGNVGFDVVGIEVHPTKKKSKKKESPVRRYAKT